MELGREADPIIERAIFRPCSTRQGDRSGHRNAMFSLITRVVDYPLRIENPGVQRYQSYKFNSDPTAGSNLKCAGLRVAADLFSIRRWRFKSSAVMRDQANNRILLPRLGWLRYRTSRSVLGWVRNVTVTSSGTDWFVSILTERQVDPPIAQGVGIDMGVIRFATSSDGTF